MRPTSTKKADMESENNTETHHPQDFHMSKGFIELSDEEPYNTPSVLKRTQKVAAPPPDNTEVEDSEAEEEMK